jgi:hypothetical protein
MIRNSRFPGPRVVSDLEHKSLQTRRVRNPASLRSRPIIFAAFKVFGCRAAAALSLGDPNHHHDETRAANGP